MDIKNYMKQKFMYKYYILAVISILLLIFLMAQGSFIYDKYYYLVNFGFSIIYIILLIFDRKNLIIHAFPQEK